MQWAKRPVHLCYRTKKGLILRNNITINNRGLVSITRWCSHCCIGKAVNVTYSVGVFVALCIQHAMCMRHIVMCDLSACTVSFHITSQTVRFPKKKLWIKKCISISSTTVSEIFLILRRTGRDMIKNVYFSSRNVPLFLSNFNQTWIFSTEFLKILAYHISWKSV